MNERLLLALLLCATWVHADEGAYLIDQSVVLAGLDAGDPPGFPLVITQPGRYRLVGVLDTSGQPNASSLNLVEIRTSDVTLDLNGYGLQGPTTCTSTPLITCTNDGSGAGIAIDVAGSLSHVSVHGGFIRGAPGVAVDGNAADNQLDRCNNCEVSNLFITEAGSDGIAMERALIRDNQVWRVGGSGIAYESNSHVIGNVIVGVGGDGITRDDEFGAKAAIVEGNILRLIGGTALRLGSQTVYRDNTLAAGSGDIVDGINQGGNLCGTSACP